MAADECPACGVPLGLFTPRERQRHVNQCLDAGRAAPSSSAPTGTAVTCAICSLDITTFTAAARAEHANRCLDATAPAAPPVLSPRRLRPVAPPDAPPCDPAVLRLLQSLALTRYAARFAKDEVDIDALRMLGEADLVAMRIPEAARRRLAAALTNVDLLHHLAGDVDRPSTQEQEEVPAVQATQQLPESRLPGARTRREDTDFDAAADAYLYTQRSPAADDENCNTLNLDGGSDLDDLYDSACIGAALGSQGQLPISPAPLGDTNDDDERPATPEDDKLVATIDHESPVLAPISPPPLRDTRNGDEGVPEPEDNEHLVCTPAESPVFRSRASTPPIQRTPPRGATEEIEGQQADLGGFGKIRLRYATSPPSERPGMPPQDGREGRTAQCDECKLDDAPESGGLAQLDRWRDAMRERELKRHKRKLDEIDSIYRRLQTKVNNAQSDVVDLTLDDTPAPKEQPCSVIDTATSPAPWQQRQLESSGEREAADSGRKEKRWKTTIAHSSSESESEEQSFAQRVAARCKRSASVLDEGLGSTHSSRPPPAQNVRQEEVEEPPIDLTQCTTGAAVVLQDARSRDTVISESQSQSAAGAGRGSRLKRARKCTHDDLRGAVRGDAALYDVVLQGRMVDPEALMACATRRGLKASWALIDDFAVTEGLSVRARAVVAGKARGAQWFKDMCTQELQL